MKCNISRLNLDVQSRCKMVDLQKRYVIHVLWLKALEWLDQEKQENCQYEYWVIFFPANIWSILWALQQSNEPTELSLVALHSCPTNENWLKKKKQIVCKGGIKVWNLNWTNWQRKLIICKHQSMAQRNKLLALTESLHETQRKWHTLKILQQWERKEGIVLWL